MILGEKTPRDALAFLDPSWGAPYQGSINTYEYNYGVYRGLTDF
jgi:hypothetical protein